MQTSKVRHIPAPVHQLHFFHNQAAPRQARSDLTRRGSFGCTAACLAVGFDPTDLRDRRLWQHLQAKREEVLAASESESESEADVALSAGQEGLDGNLTDESNSTAPIEAEEDCLQFSEVEDEVQLT